MFFVVVYTPEFIFLTNVANAFDMCLKWLGFHNTRSGLDPLLIISLFSSLFY